MDIIDCVGREYRSLRAREVHSELQRQSDLFRVLDMAQPLGRGDSPVIKGRLHERLQAKVTHRHRDHIERGPLKKS